MTGLRIALAVLRKDLLLDVRSKDRLGHMAVFAALIAVLLSIALPASESARRAFVPALMWVVLLLTSLLGLARSFQSESEQGAVAVLVGAPCDRGWVFLGKAAANGIALLGVALWTALLFTVFLGADWDGSWRTALGIALLGTGGLTVVGTLLSGMAISVRFREFLLPILLFPLVLPVVVIASRMTAEVLAGQEIPALWWGALALYDWVFLLIGYFVFDFVLED